MKHLPHLTLTALAAISFSACGGSSDMDHDKMDHSKTDDAEMKGDTGHTTGVIISISPDGKEATINHQEIKGVGMGAMTMGFGITSMVDLSGFAEDDKVSFMVKKGRDGSYRITAMCNTDIDGKDCLNSKMDHSGH